MNNFFILVNCKIIIKEKNKHLFSIINTLVNFFNFLFKYGRKRYTFLSIVKKPMEMRQIVINKFNICSL